MKKENKITRPLEILVVEDKEENREAAQKYFNTRSDVHIDMVTNYTKAIYQMKHKIYAFGIFDVKLPHGGIPYGLNDNPRSFGYDLAEESEKLSLDWAMITGLYESYSETPPIAYVKYCFNTQQYGKIASKDGFHRVGGYGYGRIPKLETLAWRIVYETLLEEHPNIAEKVASKKHSPKIKRKMKKLTCMSGLCPGDLLLLEAMKEDRKRKLRYKKPDYDPYRLEDGTPNPRAPCNNPYDDAW